MWDDFEEDFSPITWSKNFESGYISTAPLIAEGAVLFKTPQGIKALNIEGDELWNTNQESYFELSPLIHLGKDNFSVCNHDESNDIGWPDLIITGWTTGEVSAHRLVDGGLHWSWNSEVIRYGITGKIIVENTSHGWQVVVPTESGLAGLCPVNGELIWEKNFPDNGIGYRHTPTLFIKENTEWVVVGNENGQMMDVNLSDLNTSIIIDFEYDLENPKIRGPIIVVNSEIERRFILIQGDSSSMFVEWGPNTSKTHRLIGSTGLLASYEYYAHEAELVVVPTSTNTTLFNCRGDCVSIGVLTNQSVTGEPVIHSIEKEIISIFLPHNINQGYWSMTPLYDDSGTWIIETDKVVNWYPKEPQYVTAGVAVSQSILAVANDASYAEVIVLDFEEAKSRFELMRQSNQNWIGENQQTNISEQIGIVEENQQTNISEQIGIAVKNDDDSIFSNAVYFIFIVIFIGIIAKLFSTLKSDDLRWPLLIFLVALILILPGIVVKWTEFVDSNNSAEQQLPPESEIPLEWADSQIVIIEFPNYESNGTETKYNQYGEEIERGKSSNNNTNRIIIGGLSNSQNVWEVTLQASNLSGLEIEYVETYLGVFITSINGMENSGLNGWVYTINTRYGTQSVDAAIIDSNSTVIWQYK